MMSELRPDVFDHFGLNAAIRREAQAFAERSGISCVANVEGGDVARNDDSAVAALRTLQEALAAAAERRATRVLVDLTATEAAISATIEDDGTTMTTSSLSWGLVGMREQIHSLGGILEADAPALGGAVRLNE